MVEKKSITETKQGDLVGRLARIAAQSKERQAKIPINHGQKREPLAPIRHPNMDLFVCDVLDAVPKDDMGSMEHPMFTLSKKPDFRVFHYEHKGNFVDISPGIYGLATIYDKDILIFCVSQLIAKMNEGIPISKTVELTVYDLLVSTNRPTGGDSYKRLNKAFNRLATTYITTNVINGKTRIREGFSLIDSWRIAEKSIDDARMVSVKVNLSEWLFSAVKAREVLTLDRDYFRLSRPIERRFYELARKHCGKQSRWQISIEVLRVKSGSSASKKEFSRMVREVVKSNHLPGYRVVLAQNGKTVIFYNRQSKGRVTQLKDFMNEFPGSKLACG